MEGEGPMAGTPRWLGFILISRDAVALDTVASYLIGLKPGEVRHIFQAGARGLGCSDLKRIDIPGEEASKLVVVDFKLPKIMWQAAVPKFLSNLIYKKIALRPHIFREKCSLCAECSQRCPVGAMAITERKLIIDYRLCIGCLCCQEICSSRAIMSRRSLFGEALLKGFRAVQKIKEGLS
jgi:Pyruvate/2-oxoacid:ferredoxin oxidoreductase delta subunit